LDELRVRVEARAADAAVTAYALAALEGTDQLEAALDGEVAVEPTAAPAAVGAASPRTTLRRIRVAGFRGIGATADLDLTAGPGLTLVVGRNGSGKSSFAEAVELAMTGANARWEKRSKVWKDGWRNLHDGDQPSVTAELVVDGQRGSTVVERGWGPDAGLADGTLSVRTPTGPSSLEELGWRRGLDLHRPFLPYSELGQMVDEGPTTLHDALAAVLGLDELTEAAKRCRDARLQRERAWRSAAAEGQAVADDLDHLDGDARAAAAADELRTRAPSFAALEELVAGSAPDSDRTLQLLRDLAGLRGPDLDAVRRTARELDDAIGEASDHAGTSAARDLEVADLLAAARAHHADHGDTDCPVCGGGRLDDGWATAAAARETELRAAADAVQRTHRRLEAATRAVRELVGPAPGFLERGGVTGVEVTDALRAYEAWAAVPRTPERHQQPAALLTAADELAAAVTQVRTDAAVALREREDRWRPLAVRVAGWLASAREVHGATGVCGDLKAAEKLLADVLDETRAERWAPIAQQARDVWAQLRQRSNVSIDDVALAGSGVKRRVEVSVTVDGVEGAALGVMSQGELHALALSLFLPRATLPESPFGFLVLDDPVQSMDPSRVDGLARVLETVAADRQVVVFTHDDRLPEAIRRLGITARILEVVRGTGSQVSVREVAAPWRRHLDDARALAASTSVPELVRRTAVPGFCRLALEAAAIDRYRRQAAADGTPHDEQLAELEAATKLLPLLSLALFGTASRAGEVYGRCNRVGGWATDAIKAANEGSHGRFQGDPAALVDDVGDLIGKVLT
jgi:energy-coupling factor transporter ATP-binding protein EcfA2